MRRHTHFNPYGSDHPAVNVHNLKADRIVRVVSDLHFGQHDITLEQASHTMKLDPKHFVHEELLKAFLKDTISNHLVSHLILNGDILDNWSVPMDETPPRLADILAPRSRFAWFKDIIRDIYLAGKAVVYVRGNHDADIDAVTISEIFGDTVHFAGDRFILDSMCFEHGHRYDIFNAPDLGHPLPLGYFVSRICATCGTLGKKRSVFQDALSLMPARLVQEFFAEGASVDRGLDAILRLLGRADVDRNLLPREFVKLLLTSCFGEGIRPSEARFAGEFDVRLGNEVFLGETLNRVVETHADFFEKCQELVGDVQAARLFRGGANGGTLADVQKPFVQDILRDCPKVDVVVFGHSHLPKVERLSSGGRDVVFANCGSFQGGKNARARRPSVIEITCKAREKIIQVWHPEGVGWRSSTLGGDRSLSSRVILKSSLVSAAVDRELSPQRAFTSAPRGRVQLAQKSSLIGGMQRDSIYRGSPDTRFVGTNRNEKCVSPEHEAALAETRRLRGERAMAQKWAGAGVSQAMRDQTYQ